MVRAPRVGERIPGDDPFGVVSHELLVGDAEDVAQELHLVRLHRDRRPLARPRQPRLLEVRDARTAHA